MCLSDEKIAKQGVNFFSLNAWPNLIGDSVEDVVAITTDMSYYKQIIPGLTQNSNFFFNKSIMSLEDKMYDLYETGE